jgi:hypothetical protein
LLYQLSYTSFEGGELYRRAADGRDFDHGGAMPA